MLHAHRQLLPLMALGLLLAPAVDGRPQGKQAGGDWPLFRGNPLQTGVASSTLPEDLVVRWKFKNKDSIEAAADVVGGVVYAGSFDETHWVLDMSPRQR